MKAWDQYASPRCSPDHARGGIAHGRVFRLDEFLVVVDAAVDFVVLFALQLLLRRRKTVHTASRKLKNHLAKELFQV